MRRVTNPVASAAQQLDEMCTLAAKDLGQQALARIRELIDVTSERSRPVLVRHRHAGRHGRW